MTWVRVLVRVHPRQGPVDPQPGLVDVHHRGRRELAADRGGERPEPGGGLLDDGGDGPDGHRRAEQISQGVRGPGQRQVLRGRQIGRDRPHPGPYWVGAPIPAGTPSTGPAIVTVPQPHRRCCRRCSVTCSAIGGRSNTCRAAQETTGAPASPAPQPPHTAGACTRTRSGSATCRNVAPGAPSCPPGRRPDDRRCERGAGLA